MIHPFENLLPNQRNQLAWISLFAATLVFAAIYAFDSQLKTVNVQVGPFHCAGLVGLSLARNPEIANDVCSVWQGEMRFQAGLAIGLDFLLILLYAIGLTALAVSLSENIRARYSRLFFVGRIAAWAVWVAAVADVIENIGLMIQVSATPSLPWSEVTFLAAMTKFGLLAFAFMAVLILSLMAWRRQTSRTKPQR